MAICFVVRRKINCFHTKVPRLTAKRNQKYASLERQTTSYKPLETFALEKEKHYQQQYGDMYFLRLTKLKPAVERIAEEAWDGFQIAGETVRKVDRVLDVRQGELCWVAGTIYMEMPLKPNILDDISKDVSCKEFSIEGGADLDSTGYLLRSQDINICRLLERILRCWRTNLDG